MLFEYPLAGLLHSFTTPLYLGFFIFAWGVCVVMTNFCVSFTGLMINRFVLGALESVVAPCFVVITGIYLSTVHEHLVLTSFPADWYTPKEQPIRQVLWFLGTPVFGIFGGLLGYALGNTHTEVTSWRLLYIVFGSVTALWGIFFAYAFPASPREASFLPDEDRVMSILRVRPDDPIQVLN
jgi:MFS family permease